MHKFLIAGLAAAAVAVPLLAQPTTQVAPVAPVAPPAPVARYAPLPDKVLTRAEVDAKVRDHFVRMDTNRDGFVTTAELDAGRAARKDRWQNAGIGHTMNVKRGDPNAAFDRIDSNRDGAISRDEFAKGREIRIEKRIVQGHDGAAPGAMHMRMNGGMRGMLMFKMADANNDGRVSLQEATSGALRHFDLLDANRDGRVTREERRLSRGVSKQVRIRETG